MRGETGPSPAGAKALWPEACSRRKRTREQEGQGTEAEPQLSHCSYCAWAQRHYRLADDRACDSN